MRCPSGVLRALLIVSSFFDLATAQTEAQSEVPLYGQSPAVYPARKFETHSKGSILTSGERRTMVRLAKPGQQRTPKHMT